MDLSSIREFRIIDYSVFDLGLAFLGMLIVGPILSFLFKKIGINVSILSWVIWALPIGILAHIITGNLTLMTKQFINLHSSYTLKVVLVTLTIIGFRGVKKLKLDKSK